MSLGNTFQERYLNFFQFFNSQRTKMEINNFIQENHIPIFSHMNRIHLNMIDTQNLNILFHIIRTSNSDKDCLDKLKLLIEKYNVKYNLFDNKHRTLPFYTCVKGYLESTKYLIEKMNYDINKLDFKEETLFFSAIRSYNIELVKYLDEKYQNWIFFPNKENNSCIYYIFKDSLKKEGENNIKNILRFIINRCFNIDEKNNNDISFKDLCSTYGIINYLEDVLKEFENSNNKNNQKLLNDNDNNDDNLILQKKDKNYLNNSRNYNNNDNYIITTNNTTLYHNSNKNKLSSDKVDINNIPIENCKENKELDNIDNEKENQIEINNIKSINQNKIIDSDNSDISLNNNIIISSNKNKKDDNFLTISQKDFMNNEINEDFYSFSEHSGLYINNVDNNEKIEKNKKCCIFVNSQNDIIMKDINVLIKQNENLTSYLDKIILNKHKVIKKGRKNKKSSNI